MDGNIHNPVISPLLGNNPSGGQTAIQLLLQNLLSLGFGLGGVIFFIMLIRGGYEYMTAGGDKEAVQKATRRLTTALIGISILFSTFAILKIVETLFGINLRQFSIPNII